MFFPILFLCVVGFVTLLLSGGQHYLRRCMFVGGVLIAFLGLMFLVLVGETAAGMHPEPLPTLAISLVVGIVLVIVSCLNGSVRRLGHLWTPET